MDYTPGSNYLHSMLTYVEGNTAEEQRFAVDQVLQTDFPASEKAELLQMLGLMDVVREMAEEAN